MAAIIGARDVNGAVVCYSLLQDTVEKLTLQLRG